ncbi:MFS transporter, partial [Dehalococcoidia bacterium]|nr:MFS transporter [Dehalococcoidia bacterium]
RQAIVYNIVEKEDLPNAVALNSVVANATRIFGPALGGVLSQVIGVDGAFFFMAGCYVIGIATLTKIGSAPPDRNSTGESFARSLVSGVQYAKKDRTVGLLLILGILAAILAWPYLQLMPAYTEEVLGVGRTGLGYAMASVGAGSVVGALYVAATASKLGKKGTVMVAGLIANGVLLVGLAFADSYVIAICILVMMGLVNAVHMSLNQILVQLNVQDEYRGRALALHFVGFGLQPIGALPAGAIGEIWGIQAAFLALGIALVLVIGYMACKSRHVFAM